MIEAIVTAALAKIAEGSGTALVNLIRGRFRRNRESEETMKALEQAEQGTLPAEGKSRLSELLAKYAAEDPELLRQLQTATTAIGTNVVTSSNVGKLIQAQNVGDITM